MFKDINLMIKNEIITSDHQSMVDQNHWAVNKICSIRSASAMLGAPRLYILSPLQFNNNNNRSFSLKPVPHDAHTTTHHYPNPEHSTKLDDNNSTSANRQLDNKKQQKWKSGNDSSNIFNHSKRKSNHRRL